MINSNVIFPSQKKSYKEKNEEWKKKCVDAGEAACIWKNEGLRKSFYTKRINYNLYSDILDQEDIEAVTNPMGIQGLKSPAKMQNYPIANPKIDLLVGESITRRFDYKVRTINDDAISQKEGVLREQLKQMLIEHLTTPDMKEEQIAEQLKNFKTYQDHEYQDSKERLASQILNALYKSLRLDNIFAQGFKDALIVAEEWYLCDVIAGEPVVKRINPMNTHTVRSGESAWVEDSDIIVIVDYLSPGQIIDEYHEELTPSQIDDIERGMTTNITSSKKGIDIGRFYDLPLDPSNAIDISSLSEELAYGGKFDNNGNIRRARVYWKSMRKLKKVKYYDAQGDEQYELYDENYKIDKSKGETETILWVSEWWEGHKLGGSMGFQSDNNAIYTKIRPKPIQFRSMENPSKCHPGIIGRIYTTNDNQAVSLMDRMKPYQYLYNILAYRTELAISKNYGKIMRLGLHEIPDNWEIDKWLSFAQGMNIAVVDSFKEGNKGAAQGKLAGGMNQSSPVIDMEMGNTIQMYMNMMAFIKQELGEISGVSQSRQGQIHNRQAVGNVETEMNQSSMITEWWFQEHELVKIKVLECLLETAKYAWRDKKNKKVQYVLDDGATMIFDVDGEQFNESEYGIQIMNSVNNQKLLNAMQQLAQAGIQNDKINFSQLLDIYSTESIASIRRKIEKSEKEKYARDEKQMQQQKELQEAQLAAIKEKEEKDRNFKREEWDREDARQEKELLTSLEIERARQDNDESNFSKDIKSPDTVSLEKLKLEAIKNNREYEIINKELEELKRHNKETERLKEKEIAKKSTTTKK